MRAILKENHTQFCTLIQGIRTSRSLQAHDLIEMESELCAIFQNYRQRLNDLRELMIEYEVKKKIIRNRIKQLVREDIMKRTYKI